MFTDFPEEQRRLKKEAFEQVVREMRPYAESALRPFIDALRPEDFTSDEHEAKMRVGLVYCLVIFVPDRDALYKELHEGEGEWVMRVDRFWTAVAHRLAEPIVYRWSNALEAYAVRGTLHSQLLNDEMLPDPALVPDLSLLDEYYDPFLGEASQRPTPETFSMIREFNAADRQALREYRKSLPEGYVLPECVIRYIAPTRVVDEPFPTE